MRRRRRKRRRKRRRRNNLQKLARLSQHLFYFVAHETTTQGKIKGTDEKNVTESPHWTLAKRKAKILSVWGDKMALVAVWTYIKYLISRFAREVTDKLFAYMHLQRQRTWRTRLQLYQGVSFQASFTALSTTSTAASPIAHSAYTAVMMAYALRIDQYVLLHFDVWRRDSSLTEKSERAGTGGLYTHRLQDRLLMLSAANLGSYPINNTLYSAPARHGWLLLLVLLWP